MESHNEGIEIAFRCYSFPLTLYLCFHFPADVKKLGSFESSFLQLRHDNVVVPTAMKSHIANGILSIRRESLRSPNLRDSAG